MPKDFLTLLSKPANLREALRKLTFGAAISAAGLVPAHSEGAPSDPAPAEPSDPKANIVDYAKKARRLILQLPGQTGYRISDHRSHRSHSSHRSHYSGSSGGASAPPAPTAPSRTPPSQPVASSAANKVTAVIDSVDREKRLVVVRYTAQGETQPRRRTFAYRDDTKFANAVGITYRFDEYADTNSGRLPIAVGDRVEVEWRTSTDGKTQIATTVQRKQ